MLGEVREGEFGGDAGAVEEVVRGSAGQVQADGREETVVLEGGEGGCVEGPGWVVVGEVPGAAGSVDVEAPAGGEEVFQRAGFQCRAHLYADGGCSADTGPAEG